MRRVLIAAGAVLALSAGSAHASSVVDPVGDFLPTFVGTHDADLDVTSFAVSYNPVLSSFLLNATLAGTIDPSKAGLYVIGINTGTGPAAPFGALGEPNVRFNQVAIVQKTGTASIGANALSALISGDSFSLTIPLALLPSTGFTPEHYGFNLWPRNGLGNNNQISDFSPQNATLASAPEPATWAMLTTGFGLLGGVLRRRRNASALSA